MLRYWILLIIIGLLIAFGFTWAFLVSAINSRQQYFISVTLDGVTALLALYALRRDLTSRPLRISFKVAVGLACLLMVWSLFNLGYLYATGRH